MVRACCVGGGAKIDVKSVGPPIECREELLLGSPAFVGVPLVLKKLPRDERPAVSVIGPEVPLRRGLLVAPAPPIP